MNSSKAAIVVSQIIEKIEMIEKNGKIVEAANAKELKSAIQSYIGNHDRMSNQGLQSLKIIRNYTLENMARVHMQILTEI